MRIWHGAQMPKNICRAAVVAADERGAGGGGDPQPAVPAGSRFAPGGCFAESFAIPTGSSVPRAQVLGVTLTQSWAEPRLLQKLKSEAVCV